MVGRLGCRLNSALNIVRGLDRAGWCETRSSWFYSGRCLWHLRHSWSCNRAHQYDKEQGVVYSCFLASSRPFRFDFLTWQISIPHSKSFLRLNPYKDLFVLSLVAFKEDQPFSANSVSNIETILRTPAISDTSVLSYFRLDRPYVWINKG